jgi:hypothetical protein
MDKHGWVSRRAYFLWESNGRPAGRDVEFWLQAEHDHQAWQICVLNPGNCPFQEQVPLSGGRHICMCGHETRECGHRGLDKLKG